MWTHALGHLLELSVDAAAIVTQVAIVGVGHSCLLVVRMNSFEVLSAWNHVDKVHSRMHDAASFSGPKGGVATTARDRLRMPVSTDAAIVMSRCRLGEVGLKAPGRQATAGDPSPSSKSGDRGGVSSSLEGVGSAILPAR